MLSVALVAMLGLVAVAALSWRHEDGPGAGDQGGLRVRLRAWEDAGLITSTQAAAIADFESERRSAGASDPRGRMAEAVGYVGAALATGALALLLSDTWERLIVPGRLALVGLLTGLVCAGGLALHRSDRGPLQRLASLLLALTVIGAGWFASIVADDVLGLAGRDTALVVGVTAATVAAPLYLRRRRGLPQLALFAGVAVTVGALLARPTMSLEPGWIGVAFWALGVAWLLLGLGNWLPPRPVAEMLGGATALLAVQFASFDGARSWLLLLGTVSAAALVALAVVLDGPHHLAVGALGLFAFVPQLVFDLFGDAIGAPATLLVVGLLLVLLAVGLGRARQEVRT